MSPEQKLLHKLEITRDERFGGAVPRQSAPHPSRLSSTFRLYEWTSAIVGILCAIAIVVICSVK